MATWLIIRLIGNLLEADEGFVEFPQDVVLFVLADGQVAVVLRVDQAHVRLH